MRNAQLSRSRITQVELIFLSGQAKAISAFRTMRIFRTFRVLRVTKLLRVLSFMKVIISVVTKSMESFVYIALLLILFIIIYALIGCQIYAGQLDPALRSNFDSFSQSFITVFQILTLENWQEILFATLHSSVSKAITIFYLVSWIFIGNLSLLNLFLAILLDGFSNEDDDEEEPGAEDDQDDEKKAQELYEKQLQKNRSRGLEHDDQRRLNASSGPYKQQGAPGQALCKRHGAPRTGEAGGTNHPDGWAVPADLQVCDRVDTQLKKTEVDERGSEESDEEEEMMDIELHIDKVQE